MKETYRRYKKLPLGITPKWLWQLERLRNLKDAIDRYKNESLSIPVEWITEYNELVDILRDQDLL